MSIRGKKYPFYLLFIPVLIILAILFFTNFTAVPKSSATGSQGVLTEMDFAEDPDLFAMPTDEIIAVFLESPASTAELKDTGEIGIDIIPYRYDGITEQTFCWDDDQETSEHFMTLVDSEGNQLVTVTSGGACETLTIKEGEYVLRLEHDGKSDQSAAVFIVPDDDMSLITVASEETLLNLTSVLRSNKCVGCDLSDANLSGTDLSGVDLSGAILSNAILVDADLSGANLNGAQLQNADLSRANLKGANLSGADLTSAILINADLSDANLTLANLNNADTEGAKITLSATALLSQVSEQDGGEGNVSSVGTRLVPTVTCTSGDIANGTGDDLEVTGDCTVAAGTYHYNNVNIHSGGSLTFKDEVIDFWAYGIVVEMGSSLIAGSEATPIGTAGGKLTIHLYGQDQGLGGSGVLCKTPTSAAVEQCGIPKTVWDSNGATKQMLPGGVEDYFYQYEPLPQDGGDPNGFFGYKVIAVSYGGTLNMFGKKGSTLPDNLTSDNSGMSWARLDGTVNVGDTQLKIDREVDWEVGDRISVTTTDYLPGHSEVMEIIAPVVDKMTFNFKVVDALTGEDIPGGLQYHHNGEPYEIDQEIATKIGWKREVNGKPAADTRAAVGLLTRDIMIVSKGDTFNSPFPPVPAAPGPGYFFGGHTIVRQGVKEFKMQGVQLHQLGQGGKMGHYPVHFHLTRKTPDGTFVKDSSITDSMTRWIVIHGTHGVTLSRNVGCMSIGHGFYLEDGTEINNKLYSNLGILARAAIRNAQNPRQVPGILAWGGSQIASVPYNSDIFNPTVFWIMNGWNDFEYNMAAGATGCGVCYWLLSGANSGPSQAMKWDNYASMQSGPMMMVGDRVYQNNIARAGMTPLKSFKGNSCSSAMMSFNTVGQTDACNGLGEIGISENPNAPAPAPDLNQETFYPKVDRGGGRFATLCPGTEETRDCGPQTVIDKCAVGNRENCDVTILDQYTTSFHWPEQNFAAVWLRPQWYLFIDSFLSDGQNGGLGFVTGGDYTGPNVVPGLWQLATRSVFVGNTQNDNPYASEAGPANPLMSSDGKVSGVVCDTAAGDACRLSDEGISIPINNFAVNQRLFNIYDGPNYQDFNAYLDIKETDLSDLCKPGGVSNCPQLGNGLGTPAWMYTRTIGIPVNKTTNNCVLPNAAIGWKQPNGFYYPPAFHSENLHFKNVDIRHYVLEPLWEPGTYTTIQDQVETDYCTFPGANMFGNFSSVDRQTVLNDEDGSLTGLLSPPASPAAGETISVNLDPFFNAPIEAIECESFDTAKTSPYEYLTTVVYPSCVGAGTCGNTWSAPCTSAACYGVPLDRQLLTKDDFDSNTGELDLGNTGIRMAGMAIHQRSMMTLNGATYYIDTTVPESEQSKSATDLNVFRPGDTYNVFFLYTKETTNQTYQIYVGKEGFDLDNDVNFIRTNILMPPISFEDKPWPDDWTRSYNSDTGILTVSIDLQAFEPEFEEAKMDFCQPKSFCDLNQNNDCVCSPDLTGDIKASCELGNICGKWAGNDIDCPLEGCFGFSFKLPTGFVADNMGSVLQPEGHRPAPSCFPMEEPWTANLVRASSEVAGSCDMTPIDDAKFCTDTPGGGNPPPPVDPPVGGAEDKDGDGLPDSVDVDSDNDGIPDSAERATVNTNSSSETTSRNLIIPADPDGDGIPNELDLDSDGDCIPDHLEAGGTNDTDRDGLSDNFVDADADGHHDAHDEGQGGSALLLPDTDGDRIPDFLDHDSDGDGMTDTEETGGTIDANDDGIHDVTEDLDQDGIADSLHPDTGQVCVIQDTDGDGLPDHLDAVDNTSAPPTDDPGTDGDSDSGGDGSCALAPAGSETNGLAGLAIFAIIPAGILIRRRLALISRWK